MLRNCEFIKSVCLVKQQTEKNVTGNYYVTGRLQGTVGYRYNVELY